MWSQSACDRDQGRNQSKTTLWNPCATGGNEQFFSGVHCGYSYSEKKLMAYKANTPIVRVIFVFSLESVQAQAQASDTRIFPELPSCSNAGIHHCCWTKHRSPILSKKEINVVLITHMASCSVTPTLFLDRVFESWPVSQDCAVQGLDLQRS